jgi:benzoylformate decarboxylase
MQPPCGPTFVSVPIDDWDQSCEPLEPRAISRTVRGDEEALAQVADALNNSERPIFVVGAEVARDDAWDEVIALAELHQAKVWASPMASRNSFPEDHPLFAGFLWAGREEIVEKLQGHDLILVLGAQVFTYHVEGHGPHIPERARLFQLTEDANIASFAPAGTAVITSLKSGLSELLRHPALAERKPPKVVRRATIPSAQPFTDSYLLHRIAALRPANTIVVEESPSSREPMHEHLPITMRDGFYTCASGGLGYALPASIGVALGRPGEKVICLLGDGSAMYTIQGLWTAAQLNLPITFIIVNNGGYDALEGFSKRFGITSLVGTKLGGLDFVEIALGQGVVGRKVSEPIGLDQALVAAFDSNEPNLIEVVVERGKGKGQRSRRPKLPKLS